MRPRISIRGSVRPSVGPSVTQVLKPRFSAVFGRVEILYWNKWSTNIFWEPPLLFSHSTHLFVHLSLHIYHMINTRKDTAQTHRCPVGLVTFIFTIIIQCSTLIPWSSLCFSFIFLSFQPRKDVNSFLKIPRRDQDIKMLSKAIKCHQQRTA